MYYSYDYSNVVALLIIIFLKPTMDQWLKQQPLKRKQEPVQATASIESAETHTSDARGDDNRKQRKIFRRYDDSYLSFGFAWCGDENEPKPQCVICISTSAPFQFHYNLCCF